MKILVAYYSRTNSNKEIAEILKKELKADIDIIEDEKDRGGWMGYFFAGFDGFFKIKTPIKTKINSENYDLVILGTPIWAGKMASPIRTYISDFKLKKVAFFSVSGSGDSTLFNEMTIITKEPISTLSIKQSQLGSKEAEKKLKEFVSSIKSYIQKKKK